ncbi:hypothetical protein WR25_27234 isoform B [Diploscapter pachys]|uniref:Anoctamin n=1 Tax=Diploscapter pachys TaxID=2018661 RepID=A0A2A2JS88_9BILA|nr:hypothetical protein WR25_27234 isoform B [Diploscapter pachys]
MLQASTEVDYPYFPFRISVDFVLVNRLDDLANQVQRQLFEKAIRREGLIIHKEQAGGQLFTLLSTPFHRLCREAERRQMSFPLKDEHACSTNNSKDTVTLINEEPLQRKGLQYLLMEGAYSDAFILHEPSEEEPYFKKMKGQSMVTYTELIKEIEDDPRKKMQETWCRYFKFQPLNSIRNYFGEQIAFYFAWQDPITGESVMFSPNIIRYLKMMCSCLVVILCMSISVVSVIAVIMYKMYIVDKYECDKEYTLTCMLLAAFTPSVLNTSSTMLLGFLYNKLVERLNYWENHRTMTEHTNALIIKVFAFSFVNNYVSLFYIAFVRPENHGFQTNGLFGLGKAFKDTCKENTCGSLLALQLMTHMLLKPFPKFSKDVIFPYFIKLFRHKLWFHRRKETLESILKESNETSVLIREWIKPNAGEFALWEFNEKVILFGTTMMFAALFPLAPLFALIFGLVDLRIDAHRLIWFNRRPVPVTTNGKIYKLIFPK